ncbi:hypothetical protein M8994_14380 [Brucella sp. 21LCYQ03]|nr:hypothetical protein [Brucella sp. 21LCYQ03]
MPLKALSPTNGGGRSQGDNLTQQQVYRTDTNFKQARASGVLKLGACVIAETLEFAHHDRLPKFVLLSRFRVKEIERVLRSRHGDVVPDCRGTDDMNLVAGYLLAVAGSLGEIDGWCRRWMPWFDDVEFIEKAHRLADRLRLNQRGPVVLKADNVAKLIHLTDAERRSLGVRTIGACDVDTATRKRAATAEKKQRDKDRQTALRKAAGCRSKAESATALKPWESAGISRASYYRKRRETKTSLVEGNKVPFINDASDETVSRSHSIISGEGVAAETKQPVCAKRSQPSAIIKTVNYENQHSVAKRSRGLGVSPQDGSPRAAALCCDRPESFTRGAVQ